MSIFENGGYPAGAENESHAPWKRPEEDNTYLNKLDEDEGDPDDEYQREREDEDFD